eukprot:g2451.t1
MVRTTELALSIQDIECPICTGFLREPVLLPCCGLRICFPCIKNDSLTKGRRGYFRKVRSSCRKASVGDIPGRSFVGACPSCGEGTRTCSIPLVRDPIARLAADVLKAQTEAEEEAKTVYGIKSFNSVVPPVHDAKQGVQAGNHVYSVDVFLGASCVTRLSAVSAVNGSTENIPLYREVKKESTCSKKRVRKNENEDVVILKKRKKRNESTVNIVSKSKQSLISTFISSASKKLERVYNVFK